MPKNGICQWGWAEMEELLQCPVCLDIPAKGVVEQCRHGHHICVNCRKKVENCPLCKCDFHGTRNFVVEELVRQFDVLKNTMLLNNVVIETKSKKKVKEKLNHPAKLILPRPNRRKVNTPNTTKGNYPCRVVNCDVVLPASRLLNHVRSVHADVLTETVVDFTDSYSQTFDVQFRNKKGINATSYVVFIRGMGLIFINVEILKSGQLIAFVQMGTKYQQAQNFLACIEFFNEQVTHSCNVRLISVRDNMQALLKKKICFTLNKNQLKKLCVNKKFQFKLRLSHFNELDAGVLTRPNVDQINTIAALRASLIQEESDKKLLLELNNCSKSTLVTVSSTSSSNANKLSSSSTIKNSLQNNAGASKSHQVDKIINNKQKLEGTLLNLKLFAEAFQNVHIMNGIQNDNVAPSTNTPANESGSGSRKRRNRNRKNR